MPGDASEAPPDSYSIANFAEVLFPCLDAVSPRRVLEIGAFRGAFTRDLLSWAADSGASVTAIEPAPPPELRALKEEHPELQLIELDSLSALAELSPADAVIIDGDHNYYTVSRELQAISEKAGDDTLPLIAFHDVCWPHARRDTYYVPERIPEEHRQPLARNARLAPGVTGLAEMGIPFPWAAQHEGGPRNGVLTAIEDFIEGHDELRLAVVPAFFGLGVLWDQREPWADAVRQIIEPWDSSPMLMRLEAERTARLVDRFRLERDEKRLEAQEQLLRQLLDSRAFALAERLSRVRQRGTPIFSRQQVRRVLGS
jgi:Methyltransferase domain